MSPSERGGIEMRIVVILAVMLAASVAATASAGDPRDIELTDGSVIRAEVLSFRDGFYTVRSESLGVIRIDEKRVRSIRTKGDAAPPAADRKTASGPSARDQVEAFQTRMLNDREIMGRIRSLQNDADFRRLMRDPEIVRALQSGNISALLANPKFLDLLNNRNVQEIQKRLAE